MNKNDQPGVPATSKRPAPLEMWTGIECTINRVGSAWHDQSEYAGHYLRGHADIDLVAGLGVRTMRYPVLWERCAPDADAEPDFSFAALNLGRMKETGINPIVGLVHHGSGPGHVSFMDGSFENGLADYARKVAIRFPWVTDYTPVNEPLTTARFCGLYGIWYPHERSDLAFYRVLISECKATVMAMQAIRQVNPAARLIQTEDLGKIYGTSTMAYQAAFENQRRWLSYDLLCGRVTSSHPLWSHLTGAGIGPDELEFFRMNPCVPDLAGFNYYITSERFLDEEITRYPDQYHGSNGAHAYADIEVPLVRMADPSGPALLLREAWEHLGIPLIISECHLHGSREDQMRWLNGIWEIARSLRADGVDLRAVTAWALVGLHGWNSLCTKPGGQYESGIFDLRDGVPQETGLAPLIRELASGGPGTHPVLSGTGWWQRNDRRFFGPRRKNTAIPVRHGAARRPLVIIGKTGTLGQAFEQICRERQITTISLTRREADITDPASIEQMIRELDPWCVVNAAGYVRVDDAETDAVACMLANGNGPAHLALACAETGVRLVTFSSDLVFDGMKHEKYDEDDAAGPLNVYGESKLQSELSVLSLNPDAIVIRSSAFFGPWDHQNFVFTTLRDLQQGKQVKAADDVFVSPTYLPDLVHRSLDLLLDNRSGIFHLSNEGCVSWAEFARQIAGYIPGSHQQVLAVPARKLSWMATRPVNSCLHSGRGGYMPSLKEALTRCLERMTMPSRPPLVKMANR